MGKLDKAEVYLYASQYSATRSLAEKSPIKRKATLPNNKLSALLENSIKLKCCLYFPVQVDQFIWKHSIKLKWTTALPSTKHEDVQSNKVKLNSSRYRTGRPTIFKGQEEMALMYLAKCKSTCGTAGTKCSANNNISQIFKNSTYIV